jgi:hypothetical protein
MVPIGVRVDAVAARHSGRDGASLLRKPGSCSSGPTATDGRPGTAPGGSAGGGLSGDRAEAPRFDGRGSDAHAGRGRAAPADGHRGRAGRPGAQDDRGGRRAVRRAPRARHGAQAHDDPRLPRLSTEAPRAVLRRAADGQSAAPSSRTTCWPRNATAPDQRGGVRAEGVRRSGGGAAG